MKTVVTMIVLTLFLCSCASTPLPETGALIVRATPKSSDETFWYRDFCNFGIPVNHKEISYGDTCANGQILHHAFLYKVRLSNVSDLSGLYYGNNIYAAMSGGKRVFWNRNNKTRGSFILQRVDSGFTRATGISFIMTPVTYDKKTGCVGSFGNYPHSDFRACPDESFHEGHYDDCLPIEDVLEHFKHG